MQPPRDLLAHTRLTAPDPALRSWAEGPTRPGEPPVRTAERLCTAVHDRLTDAQGATDEKTTAAQALAGARGVGQDYAHVMLSLCRLEGLPARCASGHLLGQGGTHAWAEVCVPVRGETGEIVTVALDPCNGGPTGLGHLAVATGRDDADVAPTAGTYRASRRGRLPSRRSLTVTSVTR